MNDISTDKDYQEFFACTGSGIRYREGPPVVRNMRAVRKTGSWGTRHIFINTGTRTSRAGPDCRRRIQYCP